MTEAEWRPDDGSGRLIVCLEMMTRSDTVSREGAAERLENQREALAFVELPQRRE